MSLIKSAVRTTAQAVGFAKGLTESVVVAGVDVVRRHGAAPAQRAPQSEPAVELRDDATATPESNLPGPDIVLAEPPSIDDLPEPIVIVADDHPGAPVGSVGEAFQTEPKATTRADADGGFQGDVFESEDEAEDEVALEDPSEQR